MMHFTALFLAVAVLVMFLGSKQQKGLDRYGVASTVLFAALALASAAMLHGTLFFPAAALSLAILLLVHRAIVHVAACNSPTLDTAPPGCPMFCCKDACHHETWIIAAVTASMVSMFKL